MRWIRLYAALIVLPVAACTAATPVPALTTPPPAATTTGPVATTTTGPVATTTGPAVTPPSQQATPPAPVRKPSPKRDTCLGAVLYTFDPGRAGTWPRPCIEVGGVVRITPHGPWDFGVAPAGRVDCFYEGGTHECRLVGTGAVTFTTSSARKLTVDVVAAVSPRRPSTECQTSGTYVLDASYGGPPWAAICLRTAVTLRIEHHGPEGVTASPAGLMSCRYEAAVRVCRLLKAGTVRLTVVNPNETRPLTIVIVR
ncbi:hypothetical protein AB0J72_40230 [Dactylosporangium sp. NPDC049742]|uniref:hypothetical protein n=1 Tax=Dactylosporangium sp. NPDC049742 TaxID=3154737 RepID=UPI0034127460